MGWGKSKGDEAELTPAAIKIPIIQKKESGCASGFGVRRVGKAPKIVKRKIKGRVSQK